MLPYLILGFALLAGVMLASRWFATAKPKALAKGVKWAILVVLLGAALALVVSGRLAWALAMVPALLMWLGRVRAVTRMAKNFSRMSQAASGAPGGGYGDGSSEVETRYFRMSLDHATGAMDGEVIEGAYAGQRLGDMSVGDLVDLLKTCWIEDEQSARVLETYLDRVHADWRADAAAADVERPAEQGFMSTEEAYKVLGLEPGADADAIKEAHRRLMAGLHPDRGGSDYLAAKINQAKDLLTSLH